MENLKANKLEKGIDGLEQNFSKELQVIPGSKSPTKKEVPSPEHNFINDEAMKLAYTITKSDELYIPSKKALANTPLLMQEVAGTPLENDNSKELYISERDVRIHAGNTLKIPVRISKPGSIVEFSIEKKSYDFLFGISAFMDGGQVAKIKVRLLKYLSRNPD